MIETYLKAKIPNSPLSYIKNLILSKVIFIFFPNGKCQ